MDPLAFMDLEWSNGHNRSICQISVIDSNGDIMLSTYVDPKDGFDHLCMTVHGITSEKVEGSPDFTQLWDQLNKILKTHIIIGHNIRNADLSAINMNAERYGFRMPEVRCVDTYDIAKDMIDRLAIGRYSLQALREYYGIDAKGAHDALKDASDTREVFYHLTENCSSLSGYTRRYVPRKYHFAPYVPNPAKEYWYAMGHVHCTGDKEFVELWLAVHRRFLDSPDCIDYYKKIERSLEVVDQPESKTDRVNFCIGMIEALAKSYSAEAQSKLLDWIHATGTSKMFPMCDCIEIAGSEYPSSGFSRLAFKIGNPVEPTRKMTFRKGQRFCLTGTFSYGPRKNVEKYIQSNGGTINPNVVKSTDYVIKGDLGDDSYSFGSFGTKTEKALEYHIPILDETTLFRGQWE